MEERLLELVRLALKYNGTDIHFTLIGQEIKIEMRIDGHMKTVKTKYGDYKLVRYLMYLANMDVGLLSSPQTRTFEMDVDNSNVKLRFAIIQTADSKQGVLRILNNQIQLNYKNNVKQFIDKFNKTVDKGCGLYIISGPTGSGKTLLAYSILNSIKKRKIYSVEDPIEVYNDNIVQIGLNQECELTYKTAIRQILRHDPDIIFLDDFDRDSESITTAFAAANTGCIVLATMHSSDCKHTVSRLEEYGISKEQLNEQLKGIVNLRLNIKENGEKEVTGEFMEYDVKPKVGDKIKIVNMDGDKNYAGKTGTVEHIDDAGYIHGTWGGCAVIPEVDSFEILSK